MAKFELNEVVIYVGPAVGPHTKQVAPWKHGQEIQIERVYDPQNPPTSDKWRGSYGTQYYLIDGINVPECYLDKKPDDQPFTSWFQENIITDIRPTETQVRIGLKGILEPFGRIDYTGGVRSYLQEFLEGGRLNG